MNSAKGRPVKSRQQTVELFVAPNGDDRWSGRLPEPAKDRRDGPFATVLRARNAIRSLRKKPGAVAVPVRVRIRGTHYLDETLTFGPSDSGTAKAPVVYTAYEGECPVLSGGQRVTGWREEAVGGRACWVADLPAVAKGEWHFTQLFVNGRRRPRARLPKEGYYRFAAYPEGVEPVPQQWLCGPDRMHFRPGDIQPWRNLDDVKLVALQLWFEAHHRIKELDLDRSLVAFRAKSLGGLKDEKGEFARYFLENVFEALDTPGEWYLDRPSGKLYYLPMPGETPTTTEVIAPRLDVLVSFAGSERRPVSHIRLENLRLLHSEWDYPADDPGSIQAAFKVPGAVVFDRAESCVLYGCELAHIAQYGIEVRTGSSGNQIVACSIHDMGAGGVRIGHEWMRRQNETTVGPLVRTDSRPMATTVSDCEIHDGAMLHPSAIGVWVGNSGHNRILHNHIFNMNYTGISCGWTWGYAPTATVDNRIEFNHIHHINWSRVLSDNGGIYTLGIQPGTTLRGNLIHHIGCYGYGGWGIYPDEGTSEVIIENNVVYQTDDAGFSTHYGRDNVVRNNIFALSGRAHINPGMRLERHRTTVFERNIVCWEPENLRTSDWPLRNYLFRDNLLWKTTGPVDFGNGTTLDDWQAGGQHRGTILADPLFADPEAGDFSMRRDSPALRLGFKPIDLSHVGPRLGGRRPSSLDQWRAGVVKPKPIVCTLLELDTSGKLRLTVRNVGDATASGRLRLSAWPAGEIAVRGKASFTFRGLKPGGEKAACFEMEVQPGVGSAAIETHPTGRGLVPALLHVPRQWRIGRTPPIAAPADIGGRLESLDPVVLSMATRVAAALKLAVAGGDLAIEVAVNDRTIRRISPAWQGSCVELFADPADARPESPVVQLFLLPAAGAEPAEARRQDGVEEKPEPEIRVASEPTADGYMLRALIPLTVLKLATDLRAFRVEVAVTTALRPGVAQSRVALFGAVQAYSSSVGYGTVEVGC